MVNRTRHYRWWTITKGVHVYRDGIIEIPPKSSFDSCNVMVLFWCQQNKSNSHWNVALLSSICILPSYITSKNYTAENRRFNRDLKEANQRSDHYCLHPNSCSTRHQINVLLWHSRLSLILFRDIVSVVSDLPLILPQSLVLPVYYIKFRQGEIKIMLCS